MRRVIALAVLVTATLSPTHCWAVEADRTVIETLMGEAGGQGMIGMQAVAEVIRTRARQRHLTPAAVCLQKWQFSYWNIGTISNRKFQAKTVDEATRAWELSKTSSITKGADHYYADYIKKPSWAQKMQQTVKIGRHIFYKSY